MPRRDLPHSLQSRKASKHRAALPAGCDVYASSRVVNAEKCTASAVDGSPASDCNRPMGRRARKALARKLRVLRLVRGWTQEDLAEASGLHRTYVSLVERGRCNISLDNLERLAEALELSLPELFSTLDATRERMLAMLDKTLKRKEL